MQAFLGLKTENGSSESSRTSRSNEGSCGKRLVLNVRGAVFSSGSVWGPSLAIPSLRMDASQLGNDCFDPLGYGCLLACGAPSPFVVLTCGTDLQFFSF